MAKDKKYIFNPKTLSYEVKRHSRKYRALKTVALFAMSVGMAVLYFWLYTGVLGLVIRSIYAPVAQLDRVSGYEPEGQGFESLPARHKKQYNISCAVFYLL